MADVKRFEGEAADVTWDRRLCIHIGECGRAKGDLFASGRDPWCQPDLAQDGDTVHEVVLRCPTGALVTHRKDGGATETAEAEKQQPERQQHHKEHRNSADQRSGPRVQLSFFIRVIDQSDQRSQTFGDWNQDQTQNQGKQEGGDGNVDHRGV